MRASAAPQVWGGVRAQARDSPLVALPPLLSLSPGGLLPSPAGVDRLERRSGAGGAGGLWDADVERRPLPQRHRAVEQHSHNKTHCADIATGTVRCDRQTDVP